MQPGMMPRSQDPSTASSSNASPMTQSSAQGRAQEGEDSPSPTDHSDHHGKHPPPHPHYTPLTRGYYKYTPKSHGSYYTSYGTAYAAAPKSPKSYGGSSYGIYNPAKSYKKEGYVTKGKLLTPVTPKPKLSRGYVPLYASSYPSSSKSPSTSSYGTRAYITHSPKSGAHHRTSSSSSSSGYGSTAYIVPSRRRSLRPVAIASSPLGRGTQTYYLKQS